MMCLCYVCRIFTISLLLLVPIKANDNERKEIDANARHRRASILDFMGSQSATPCVADAKGLVSAINSLPSAGSKTNLIRLCSERIKLSSELGAMGEGIDISDKKIELRCFLPSPKRCILDAEGVSRIFYGSKTSFYAVKVDFMNAGNYEDSKYGSGGGALQFVGGSKVSLRDCTFSACSADTGGAIQMVDSALTLKGPTIFKRNKASILGGAVHLDGSNLTAIEGHVDYLENEASFAGGALYCYNSVSKLKRNSFSGNIVAGDEDGNAESSTVYFISSSVSLEFLTFIKNSNRVKDAGALRLENTKAHLNQVKFIDNIGGDFGSAMHMMFSKVLLTDTVFARNIVNPGGDGADIYIVDDLKPSSGGTMATCRRTSKSYNMFCNGSSKINDQGSVENTDCQKKGVAGRIGRGRCNV